MKKALIAGSAVVALATASALALVAGPSPQSGQASSHREAPLISDDPSADNTDLYAFRPAENPDTVAVIANWIPAEDPAAGPMYYTFSPTARYNINIDKNGDAKADIVYRVTFKASSPKLFLRTTVQGYTVTRIANGRASVVARGVTPPNNIGDRTTPNYRNLAASRIYKLSTGGRIFAGQRDDAFFGDLGAIFDLVAIRKPGTTGDKGGGKDFFSGYAVHAIALELPIAQLRNGGNNTIGIWSSTDRRNVTVSGKVRRGYTQVSRIANPLVNEVVVPTQFKDLWNRSAPVNDKQFAGPVLKPILAKLLNQLYKVNAPETNRTDLVQVFGTGIPGLNFTGKTVADLLRLNLTIAPTAKGNESRLGVIGGDKAGFPNGRRLGDDVIDIAERVVAGELKGNKVPLGDGVDSDDVQPMDIFPYEHDPAGGFENLKGKQKP